VCAAFPAITYSRTDTMPTRRQIVGHNAARKELCAAEQSIIDSRYVCSIFTQITYSRVDTALTRRQIVGHNAVYAETCAAI